MEVIIKQYHAFLQERNYPCVGAKAALAKQQLKCMVAGNLGAGTDDKNILQFLYNFIDDYRKDGSLYHSAAIIFTEPELMSEEFFDTLMWERLQALHDLDSFNYTYDNRVDANPSSPNFSFSIKQEAFFIIGMHKVNSRLSRQFRYPALVFNPHQQFQQLRVLDKYQQMKDIVRKRDIKYSGSVNPMLDDFGRSSEVYQYSGRQYDSNWRCPLIINNGKTDYHPPA